MNTIENAIKDIIHDKLDSGLVEKLVAEQLEKGIEKALEDIFGSWGSGTKSIKSQVESVILPFLEGYDYSKYIMKLDTVLCEILQNCTADNRLLLENFKKLTIIDERKEIQVSDLFETWCKHVAEHVETTGLDVEYGDPPSYESVDVTCRFEQDGRSSWSHFDSGRLIFECDHDENMNFEVRLDRWSNDRNPGWNISGGADSSISSLRYLGDMDILMMRLRQSNAKIIIDEECIDESVEPEAEPELEYR